MGILDILSEYAWQQNGTASEVVSLEEPVNSYFTEAEERLVQNGAVLTSAIEAYGEGTTVNCDGWYDGNGRYYSKYGGELFSDTGMQEGDVLELYAVSNVQTGSENVIYVPCILDVELRLGFLNPTMIYMMGMPEGSPVMLPEIEGYTLQWTRNGEVLSTDTITVNDGFVNRYGLQITME